MDPQSPSTPGDVTRRDILATGTAAGALALVVPQLSESYAGATSLPPANVGTASLRARAEKKGLLVGSAVSAPMLAKDDKLRAVLKADASVLTPENELKWSRLQATAGSPLDFSGAEAIYAFASANNIKMRGHNLAWWNAKPAWAKDVVDALTPGAAGDMLQDYVTKVVSHWRGRLVQWDVVNEPTDQKGNLVDKMWADKLGERYIDLAYEAARAADPDALLVLNQNLIEQEDPYQLGMRIGTLRLLESLHSRNVPLQVLGIESHLSTGTAFSESAWRQFLDTVTASGLKLMVTELDISDKGTLGDVPYRDSTVAGLTRAYLDVVLSYRQCLGVVTWGEADNDSWLNKMPDRKRRDGLPLRPTPRDANYQPKPMWRAIAAALDAAPSR